MGAIVTIAWGGGFIDKGYGGETRGRDGVAGKWLDDLASMPISQDQLHGVPYAADRKELIRVNIGVWKALW